MEYRFILLIPIALPRRTVPHPQKTQISIYPQNEVSASIRLVNSPHSAGDVEGPAQVLHPSLNKVPILSYNIDRRVPQGSDQRSVHPNILLLTIDISRCLMIEHRKQGSYREVSSHLLPDSGIRC